MIPKNMIDPVALKFLTFVPMPTCRTIARAEF